MQSLAWHLARLKKCHDGIFQQAASGGLDHLARRFLIPAWGLYRKIPLETAPPASFLARHEFLIRRLHSLSGLLPIGAYMCIHLLTNATVVDGARAFQGRVDQIHSLGSMLPLVEWTFIFLPIIFHAVIGVVIARGGLPNTSNYPYPRNVRYTLQRATAWIALFFIFGHVFHMHGWFKPLASELGGSRFQHLFATTSTAAALQSSVLIQIFYVVGLLATIFHFANGLWTMGITWGVWTTPAAQNRANYFCGAVGLLLTIVGLTALVGMLRVDIPQARAVENQINNMKLMSGEVTEEEVEAAAAKIGVETEPAPTAAIEP